MVDNPRAPEQMNVLTALHRKRWEAAQEPPKTETVQPKFFDNRISLSISETAYALGISPRTVERLVAKGEIKSKRVGRRVLIPRSDIEAWLNQKG